MGGFPPMTEGEKGDKMLNKFLVLIALQVFSISAFAGEYQILFFEGTSSCKDTENETSMFVCEQFKLHSAKAIKLLEAEHPEIVVRRVNETNYEFPQYAVKLGKQDVGYLFVKGARVTTITGKITDSELMEKWAHFIKPKRVVSSSVAGHR